MSKLDTAIKRVIGKKFGRLTAIRYAGKDKNNILLWECICDCGNSKIIRANALYKFTRSCGCLQKESVTVHGFSTKEKSLYNVYRHMLGRCYGGPEKEPQWEDYGGRGIQVCEEWKKSIDSFMQWARNGYSPGLEIDRINNNGNYCPENCRWVNKNVNRLNQRSIRKDNTSGYRGVSFHKKSGLWVWYVNANGKRVWGSLCDSPKEAAEKRNEYILDNLISTYLLNKIKEE